MAKSDLILLDEIQQTILKHTKNLETFLSVQENIYEDLKNSTKQLYDLAFKTKPEESSKLEALPELIIQGFDNEQIWQQIETQNNEQFSNYNMGEISKILVDKKIFELPLKIFKDEDKEDYNEEESGNEKVGLNEDGNVEGDDNLEPDEDTKDDNDDDEFINKHNTAKRIKISSCINKCTKPSKVDDKFFKLNQLHEYLQKEDKREMNINDETDVFDEESFDLFNNFSDVDNEKNKDFEEESPKSIKYKDFFDYPECEYKDEDNQSNGHDYDSIYKNYEIELRNRINHENGKNKKKQVKFNLLNDADKIVINKNIINQETDETIKSSFEIRQERLKKRIIELEEKAVSSKEWQLSGEVNASSRPNNSLLEEYVEFDTVTRPAPIMTEKTTKKLEDIIKIRIKDKVWDDVEKKIKPIESPMEYKKRLIMNQEKSKESLAEIYENEYIKQREALNLNDKEQEKEPPEHIEIRLKIHDLFVKLNALSNFHYTPKRAKPEIKIISNVPAINMEEIAPIGTTNATLLAPEEIESKERGDLIGRTERSKTDMKRERRKKQQRQHKQAQYQNKKVVKNVKEKLLNNKVKSEKIRGRNIIKVSENSSITTGKPIKSSRAFFCQLQNQVESTIKKINKNDKNNTNKNTSDVRLK